MTERPSARSTVVVTMQQFCRGPTVTPPEPMPTVTSELFRRVPPDLNVSKRWIAFPLRAIAGLAEVQDSGSAGGEARGGCGLGLLTITTRERRGLR